MKNNSLLLAVILLSGPVLGAELGDGDDLYDKAGPNSAFVRIVNLAVEPLLAKLAGRELETSGVCTVSETVIVDSGPQELTGGNWNWRTELEAGQVYTLAVNGEQVTPFQQSAERDPLRAKFEVFNFSGGPTITVRTAESKQNVFTDVVPESHQQRQLNPLRVTLEVATENKIVEVEPVAFSRGRTTSLMICGDPERMSVAIVTE